MEQIFKYVLLMCCEEIISGTKQNTGLLFIIPENSMKKFWQKCGISGDGQIEASFLDRIPRKNLDRCINACDALSEDAFQSLLGRLKLAAISWSDLFNAMTEMSCRLDPEAQGDQTLINLLGGFCAQITDHEGTGVKLSSA